MIIAVIGLELIHLPLSGKQIRVLSAFEYFCVAFGSVAHFFPDTPRTFIRTYCNIPVPKLAAVRRCYSDNQ